MTVDIYDTTLRDGAQKEGISFSVLDKLNITRKLDELSVHFIEGGWPGANPKDTEFFKRARELKLANATLVAFGSTRRPGLSAADDQGLTPLLEAGVSVITIVGKASLPQVIQVLGTTPDENLRMVGETVSFLKSKGKTVFFDAEHFFDGFKADRDYALEVIKTASAAGAGCIVLCDTNGGSLPEEVTAAIEEAKKVANAPLGMHAHNDGGLAVANTLAAVRAGVTQVQGTINGYGERCGNASLCTIIPDLKLKMGINCLSDENLVRLTEVSRYVSEVANLPHDPSMPYVGSSAFSHKGGLHASGVAKWAGSYQHVDPSLVGNWPKVIVSDQAGRSNIVQRAKELGVELSAEETKAVLEKIKAMESRGFQYENAEASFYLLLLRALPAYVPPFELADFMVVVEKRRRTPLYKNSEEVLAEAVVKVRVGGEVMHTAAEGNGPVNALDQALRKALLTSYPELARVKLVDYKVRILEESTGTESPVRVLIESTDGTDSWRSVGSSENIIEASWEALADSLEYWLVRRRESEGRN